jgi:hypothetical protein
MADSKTDAEKAAAEKAAADAATVAAATKGLTKMHHKGRDETLHVHPTCVKAHEDAGFKVVD